ncbi:hypothetical protein [Actinomadura madurae]|uniref:hypothetical protein n=1 Tax=Actinomadura madurae TaxID=1993 RepID=UPI0020D21E86|nr:hypothetical protein [Actinomadura madurae]MCQ0011916.1 hypothetical protein [Actinomadura madurae]
MTTNAEQREDLAVRIERRIFAAMEPDPDTRIGMTLFAATCKVAEDVRAGRARRAGSRTWSARSGSSR